MALGGGGGASIAAKAFQALPFGVPKLIVTTMASGDTRPYVGESDLVLFPSVVDIAGVNRISAKVLSNAAAAMVGMLDAPPVPDTGVAQADRRQHVRRDDAQRHRGAAAARGRRLRGAHLPHDGNRRPDARIAGRERARLRRPRHHDDRTGRRSGGRRVVGWPGAADAHRQTAGATGRLRGRARHGQLRAEGYACRRSSGTAISMSTTPLSR
jgi:hypothetical protein